MGLGSLIDAIDELAADDPRVLGDGDTLVEIERQLARLEAIASRAAAAFDAGGEWRATGARSAAMWLAANTNHAVSSMRGRVRLGRDVRSMPIVEHAWIAGDIKTSHVRHLASARTPSTADLFARDEALLVGFAKTKRFSHFYRAVDYWKQRADAEGSEDADKQKVEGRHAHLSETYGGVWIGEQVFDPIGGTTVATELKRLEQQLFDAD